MNEKLSDSMSKGMNDVSRRHWILEKVKLTFLFLILLWFYDIIWPTRILIGLTPSTNDSKFYRLVNFSDYIEGRRSEEPQSV